VRRTILGPASGLLLLLLPSVFAHQASTPAVTSSPPSPSAADSEKTATEISSHDEATTFKVNVNLVLVRAVVRDAHGNAVGGLKKEDFQLFDNRKPQVITKFAVEGSKIKPVPSAASEKHSPEQAEIALPDRYIAYLFDDVHLTFVDLTQVRQAALRHLATLQATDRAALFTTSGRNTQDFTADKEKLLNALMRLNPSPITGSTTNDCPDVDYYMADLIQNKNDPGALQVATMDALACAYDNNQAMLQAAQQLAQSAAQRQLAAGDHETQVSLFTLQDAVKRISAMPGQRTIVLVSPGFFNPDNLQHQIDIADRAVRSSVVINSLDARGLYALPPGGDISKPTNSISFSAQKDQYAHQSASANADILAELANATGGTFVQNTNDLEGGLRRLASPPEYSYLLGFSPQGLKSDGKYHNLKVTVTSPERVTVQARKGYFAPKHDADTADQAKQDIEDALFSQEEFHSLPVELHTQFFKASDTAAQIAVLVRVDLRGIHFRKVDGRNRNDLTIVSALFDRDGNYLQGIEKVLEMRLRDETLQHRLVAGSGSGSGSGITLKSNFDVKPGSYLVRLVVRDAEGQISAENGAVEIPY